MLPETPETPDVYSVAHHGDTVNVTVSLDRLDFEFHYTVSSYDDEYEGKPEIGIEAILNGARFLDWDGNAFPVPRRGAVPEEILRVAEVEAGPMTPEKFAAAMAACEKSAEQAAKDAHLRHVGLQFAEPDDWEI